MFKFLKLKESHLKMVLGWRVNPEVSHHLFTEVEYNLEKQKQWYDQISKDQRYRYWIIEYQGTAVGVVNLAEIDLVNRRCNAGFYIGETAYQHVGGMVLPYLYNYVFKELKLKKIYGEVVDGNAIIKIHDFHGYRMVGTYKDHIFKHGKFIDVHLVELMDECWLSQRRYQKYSAVFEK